ncbi:MAG: SDR family NAD(P)-dependent oxidoreductase [Caulobacteraceae bacterium]|nr:SDR family NAD(P)-dependent oxidoreductase [Caulobacteraceae bacterium]
MFGERTTADEILKGRDLSGKTMVVTGAAAGIGVETARSLAAAGAKVVVTGRTPARTEESLRALRALAPQASFEGAVVELGSLASVRAGAADIAARFPKIDVLINNAGVMRTPFGKTEDGFETQFGVNHLGHFALTCLLAPNLAAGGRVVALASSGHRWSDVLWDDVNFERTPYDPAVAYGQAKTANMLFAIGLNRRLKPRGLEAFSVHPGAIHTDLGRYMSQEERTSIEAEAAKFNVYWKSVPQGAAGSVRAAVDPELDGLGGAYIVDCQPREPGAPVYKSYAHDPEAAERLWRISEDMTGIVWPA